MLSIDNSVNIIIACMTLSVCVISMGPTPTIPREHYRSCMVTPGLLVTFKIMKFEPAPFEACSMR